MKDNKSITHLTNKINYLETYLESNKILTQVEKIQIQCDINALEIKLLKLKLEENFDELKNQKKQIDDIYSSIDHLYSITTHC